MKVRVIECDERSVLALRSGADVLAEAGTCFRQNDRYAPVSPVPVGLANGLHEKPRSGGVGVAGLLPRALWSRDERKNLVDIA